MLPSTDYYLVYHVSQLGIMSHAASSCTTARTRRSAPDMTGCVDPEAPIDEVSKLPLIKCPECKIGGCFLPLPRNLKLIVERDTSSVLGKAM